MANGSEGIYNLKGGDVQASKEIVGVTAWPPSNRAAAQTRPAACSSAGAGSSGTYKLDGGSVEIQRGSTPFSSLGVVVGDAGTGRWRSATPTIPARSLKAAPGAVSMIVRNTSTAQGRVYGWGNVDLGGMLEQNGEIIADGYGQSRDLNLSSFSQIDNTIDNAPARTTVISPVTAAV